jgi:hypothetical protein
MSKREQNAEVTLSKTEFMILGLIAGVLTALTMTVVPFIPADIADQTYQLWKG